MVKVFRTASESYLVFDFARNLNIHSAIVHHVHGPLLGKKKKKKEDILIAKIAIFEVDMKV